MEIKIKSVKDLVELRDSISQIIGLAKDLGLEVIDEDKPSDNFKGFHNPNDDNQVYQIGGGSKIKVRNIYHTLILLIKEYNIYRPDICAGLTCKSYTVKTTEDGCTITYTPNDNIINISNILSGELEMLKHMIEDYFDELEK